MDTTMIRTITDPGDPALVRLPALVEAMYAGMERQGMREKLAPGGARIWLESATRGLERFGRLVVAEAGDRLIGFAHGALKLEPEHLGGGRVGHVSHLYVEPGHQGHGAGRRMAASLHDWFREKAVASIELRVVAGNEEGLAFWRALGYEVGFLQMRSR